MAKTIDDVFDKADWDALAPRLLYYADRLICAVKWRGAHVGGGPTVSASGDSFSAEDALNEAIKGFSTRKEVTNLPLRWSKTSRERYAALFRAGTSPPTENR